MNNKEWFQKIFKSDGYGITVDIVSKDRYDCAKDISNAHALPKGTMLQPIYKQALLKDITNHNAGLFSIKVGTVPPSLLSKQIEGNLVVLNGNRICHYTNFLDLEAKQ